MQRCLKLEFAEHAKLGKYCAVKNNTCTGISLEWVQQISVINSILCDVTTDIQTSRYSGEDCWLHSWAEEISKGRM
jgi:hypothetical protein